MIGKMMVTRSGYDPEKGKHVKDPYLGPTPTLGACRHDIRARLQKGDQIFFVSGKVRNVNQFVMGGFEIAEKISAVEAFQRFPEQQLREREDGQLDGNVIVDADGKQHQLDRHNKFDQRIENYLVGTNLIVLSTPAEIAEARLQTLEILQDVFQKKGESVREIIGRCSNLTDKQIEKLRVQLDAVKKAVRQPRPAEVQCKMSEATVLMI
jgi:hypothetical protein